ncbi:hypothetical protein SAY87_030986 [Trapa incisa]|uniref:Uncharacterized protein n=1 Tax=Trapa incisa TaxID=236973 RepID=A0AAN7KQC2_9MYRT|nr:hypothetical protein SAY87_030986 [Trapa incisa]
MTGRTAITHADLQPSDGWSGRGSRIGTALIMWTLLCGVFSFILCLIAEATHSQVTWVSASGSGSGGIESSECEYSGSGKTPLMCTAAAFIMLAAAVVVEHTYMLVAVSKLPPPAMVVYWERETGSVRSLTWQAGFFFVATWVCFAVAEILMLIGLSVESGHLRNWTRPRPKCLVIREGLFSAAGIFALMTVFLATGLHLTGLRVSKMFHEQEVFRREMLETSVMYASPPPSPPPIRLVAVPRENPETRNEWISGLAPAYSSVMLGHKLSSIV